MWEVFGAIGRRAPSLGYHVHVGIVTIEDLHDLGAVGIIDQLEDTTDPLFVSGPPGIFVAAVGIRLVGYFRARDIGRPGPVTHQHDISLDRKPHIHIVGRTPFVLACVDIVYPFIRPDSMENILCLSGKSEGSELAPTYRSATGNCPEIPDSSLCAAVIPKFRMPATALSSARRSSPPNFMDNYNLPSLAIIPLFNPLVANYSNINLSTS